MNQYPPNPYVAPPKKKGVPTWLLILLLAPVVMVVLFGVCAAVVIPALSKGLRKGKTEEAHANLQAMLSAADEHVATTGRCPSGRSSGQAGVTPPLELNCNEAPHGKCTPGSDIEGAGVYSDQGWVDNEVWADIGFAVAEPHFFHYDLRWEEGSDGECRFTALAYGDLDDDGTFSTFERSGTETVVTYEAE